MKKNFVVFRVIPVFFALIMIFATVSMTSLHASAAIAKEEESVSDSVSVNKVTIDTSKNFYIVKDTATVRSSASILYKKIAVISKGSLVQVSGKSGNFYTVKFNIDKKNVTYYIKASELKAAAKKTEISSFLYTNKDARALRQAPNSQGTKTNLAKGTALICCGQLKNDAGNIWKMVYRDGKVFYIYSENVTAFKNLSLKIEAPALMKTHKVNCDLKVSVSPKELCVTYGSSDAAIANLDKKGKITLPGGAGDVKITAEIPGMAKVSIESTVMIDLAVYKQTTNYTCGASSVLTILNNNGYLVGKKDTKVYNAAAPENKMVEILNKHLGEGMYVNKKVKSCGIAEYERIIRTSLRQGSPVIVLIGFDKDYFRYASSGHYVSVIGLVEDEKGVTWAIVADSFANRFSSTQYSNKETCYVTLPLSKLYEYGKTKKSMIYNP